MDIITLIDDLVNIHDCLQAARNDGGSEQLREMGHHMCDLNKTITDNVKTYDDVTEHYSRVGLVDLELQSIAPGIEQALAAEAKNLYGAAYAGAQTLRANMLGAIDDIVLQEKTLRDLIKTGIPPWAARSITNNVTHSSYTLEDAVAVLKALRKANRVSDV